jgi:hypothetical protein
MIESYAMPDEPWDRLSSLLRRLSQDGDMLTLDAAQQAFEAAPDLPLQECEILAISRAVRRKIVTNPRTGEIQVSALSYSTDWCAAHPDELVRSVLIYQVHQTWTNIDSNSVDTRSVEWLPIPQNSLPLEMGSVPFGCRLVAAGGGQTDVADSMLRQSTTRWQTPCPSGRESEQQVETVLEPCCSWTPSDDDDWASYWSN